MNNKTWFFDMFSDYMPPEPLKSVLSQAAIVAADVNPTNRSISLSVYALQYISQKQISQIQEDICALYGLSRVDFLAKFPADQLQKMESGELMELFVRHNSMTRGSLAGAKWDWQDNTLVVRLLGNGKDQLLECVPHVRSVLSAQFGVDVALQIEAGEAYIFMSGANV